MELEETDIPFTCAPQVQLWAVIGRSLDKKSSAEGNCTGYFWDTTLASKSDAVKGLRKFVYWLRAQKHVFRHTIHDIMCLQSDRGGEFTSGPESVGKKGSLFDKICKKLNITRRLISATSPNQNGKAERANSTRFHVMRCNLMDSELGWKHWGDAYRVYVRKKSRVQRKRTTLTT